MPRAGYRKPDRKTEVLQLRLTPEEKKMLFEVAEAYEFGSVAEMLITFTRMKGEKLCLTKIPLQS